MKKTILAIAGGLFIYAASSCNSAKDESNVSTGTDTSMMATVTSSATGDPAMAKPDSATMATMTGPDSIMGKPNPAKKGKKGSVTLNMGMNKVSGSEDLTDAEGYYTNVYPSYPGGDKALANYFSRNIQYPQEASENGVEGVVSISFTVDENGKVASAKTTNPKLGYGIEEEALRVFNKMPVWKAGSLKGKNVKTRYTLPVRFQLEN